MPSTPTRSRVPNEPSHCARSTRPAVVVGNDSTPSTPPLASRAAATWTSRWVSTPPVMGRVVSTMAMAIPSLVNWSRGGTHVPGWRPWRDGCWCSRLDRPPERGVPLLPPARSTGTWNLGAPNRVRTTRGPLKVATGLGDSVDALQRHPHSHWHVGATATRWTSRRGSRRRGA